MTSIRCSQIRNSIVRSNRAPSFSGESAAGSTPAARITIEDSRIIGNEAVFAGGGLHATGTVTWSGAPSPTTGRQAEAFSSNGGGISASGLNLMESTVSGNFAEAQGRRGVRKWLDRELDNLPQQVRHQRRRGLDQPDTFLLHVTIAFNRADEGGNSLHRFGLGVRASFQTRSWPADPARNVPVFRRPPGATTSSTTRPAAPDAPATGQASTRASPSVLANNGGPTLTLMLRAGSPAIDAAANVGLMGDQRGVTRPKAPDPTSDPSREISREFRSDAAKWP